MPVVASSLVTMSLENINEKDSDRSKLNSVVYKKHKNQKKSMERIFCVKKNLSSPKKTQMNKYREEKT